MTPPRRIGPVGIVITREEAHWLNLCARVGLSILSELVALLAASAR